MNDYIWKHVGYFPTMFIRDSTFAPLPINTGGWLGYGFAKLMNPSGANVEKQNEKLNDVVIKAQHQKFNKNNLIVTILICLIICIYVASSAIVNLRKFKSIYYHFWSIYI